MRHFVSLIRTGVLSIDPDGAVFRCQYMAGNTKVWRPCAPRRIDIKSRKGYRTVTIGSPFHSGSTCKVSVHRLQWELAYGPIPDGMQINHIDLDKENNRLSNLEVVTQSENIRHAHHNHVAVAWHLSLASTEPQEWRPGHKLLSMRDRIDIVTMRSSGELLRVIAQKYGISLTRVSEICKELRHANS